MRNISSAVLSLAAMSLSTLTTYLTFFDARYTLTAAVAKVSGQSNRGYGSGNGQWNVNYRFFASPTIVLSNRGTRALVVSEVNFAKSDDMKACKIPDDAERKSANMMNEAKNYASAIEPFIIEPGTVSPLELEIYPEAIEFSGSTDAPRDFDLSTQEALWCLEWVMFDPNGKRHEASLPVMTSSVSFEIEEDENAPTAIYKLDHPKGAVQLLSRGIF